MIWFTLGMAVLVGMHFGFAIREWRRWRGKESADIDLEYVRIEDYLGRSFRRKVAGWLSQASLNEHGMTLPGRGDGLRMQASSLTLGEGSSVDDVLIVKGDFECGADVNLAKEVYVEGSCRVGPRSTAQAMAIDGDLVLGRQVRVARWIDCRGSIQAADCDLGERVTAQTIRLSPGARAKSFYAGEISVPPTEPDESKIAASLAEDTQCLLLELSRPPAAPALGGTGLNPKKLKLLSADTWLYKGDFRPCLPVQIEGKLLVRGSCWIPAGSVLGDLKATGRLVIGEDCRCEGNLAAGSHIRVGSGTRCAGVIFSGGVVHLASGFRGGSPDNRTAVYGASGVFLETNSVIHGKLAAAREVRVVSPAPGLREGRRLPAQPVREGAGVASRMVMLLLCAALAGARAQEPGAQPADSKLTPVRLEIGAFGSQVSPGFGYWRGVDAQVWIRSSPRFIPALIVESQTRLPGIQQNYSFLSYMNWSPTFYTVQSISVAPQRNAQAIYYPRDREDIKAFWKVGDSRRLVLDAGFTRFNFGAPGRGQIYNAGALYYSGKLVLEGNLFVNRNQPKNLLSASGSLSAQYGRERSYWAGVTVGGGRELYHYVGIAPVDIDFSSYSIQGFYRKWLTRHVGCVVSLVYLNKLGAYRQMGTSAGMFFDF